MGKLTLLDVYLSIKQNLGHVWLLRPHTLGKLISFNHFFLNIKHNLNCAWLLRPHTLGKLILPIIFSKYQGKALVILDSLDYILKVN